MSINLIVNKEILTNEESKLQFMPAKIKDDLSNVNVDKYFNSYTEESSKIFTNALRGYPLRGVKFSVPEGYHGVIFNENKKPLNEEAERNLKATGTFKSFTYWNYDKTPSRNDALAKVVDWIDISDVLHQPLSGNSDEDNLITDKLHTKKEQLQKIKEEFIKIKDENLNNGVDETA